MIANTRRPVTLLELLVVIAILALVSGAVAISVNKALVDQKFRTEVGMVVDEFRLAQDLMIVLGRDVFVKFSVKEGGKAIVMELEHETALPSHLQNAVKGRKNILTTIKGVFLEDQLEGDVKKGEIKVKFYSRGAVMSKGVMRLATSDQDNPPAGTLQSYICLPGYPMHIASSDTLEAAKSRCSVDDKEFTDKLTNDTMGRLPERVKKADKPIEETVEDGDKKDNPKSKEPVNGKRPSPADERSKK